MTDYLVIAICAIAVFAGGVVIGRAFGRTQGYDEARRIWDDTSEHGA